MQSRETPDSPAPVDSTGLLAGFLGPRLRRELKAGGGQGLPFPGCKSPARTPGFRGLYVTQSDAPVFQFLHVIVKVFLHLIL